MSIPVDQVVKGITLKNQWYIPLKKKYINLNLRIIIPMKIRKIVSLSVVLFSSSMAFASNYNLYSDDSTKSKVLTTINTDNQDEYIRFYTDKDGKWAKYANSATGEVGWVDLGEIKQKKADALRKDLLKNIDEQIAVYNNKLSSLIELKGIINKANYEELQQYSHPSHAKGMLQFFNSWLGDEGKMHEKLGKYFF